MKECLYSLNTTPTVGMRRAPIIFIALLATLPFGCASGPRHFSQNKHTYDTAGILVQVKSLAGTGTQEIFYTPQSFNALGQLTGYTDGAGVVTANTYYNNSKRLQRVWVYQGTTNLQDLSYTYDTVSDIKSVSDGVNTSGGASASIGSVSYDDLYRVTSVNSMARGIKSYGYNCYELCLVSRTCG